MVQAAYLISVCWLSPNDITVLFINTLWLCPGEFKNKIVVYLPKINRIRLGN